MTVPTSPSEEGPNLPLRERQQKTWAAGDFSRVALGQTIVGESLCEAVELHAREKVLDVATGSGNTALAAARRRCLVTGVDFVSALLERGRQRASADQLEVDFRIGNAEELPVGDAEFDCVLSTFGVMFAPDQPRAASELARACRSGGRIGLANWTPESFPGTLFRVTAEHVPPPPGLTSPTRWGTADGLHSLFDGLTNEFKAVPRTVMMRGDSPGAFVAFFRKYFGPTVKAFEALEPSRQRAYEQDLIAAVEKFNRARDGTAFIPAEYLEVVARK